MHMRRKSLLILMTALLTSVVQDDALAQSKYKDKSSDPVKNLGYEKKLRWADGLFRSGAYFSSADYYGQLLDKKPRNPYLHYQLAESYWYLRDYTLAAKHFGIAYDLAKEIYPEAIYKSALMLKMEGKYDEAIVAFNRFIDDNPKEYKKLKKRAKLEIEGCEMGKKSYMDPIDAAVFNLGPNVNTAYTEAAPLPLGDSSLLFSTMKTNQIVDIGKMSRDQYVSRFMISHKFKDKEEKDTFQWALRFNEGNFNDSRFHVSNGSYSPGGERFFFTRCLEADSGKMDCRIFVSEFSGDRWGEPQEMGFEINIKGSSSTQPHSTKIGKKEILFFVSDRELQSRGKNDIWYTVYDPKLKTYRRPQNAGKQINTEGNEATPYYDQRTGTLYFSSDGWKTMGGYDVYSAVGGPSRYKDMQNLGYPINTSTDELYYVLDDYGKPDAYVVSNRVGSIALKNPTCCDDIWRIQYEPKLFVMGKVLKQSDQTPMSEVVVKMVDESGNIKTFNSTDGQFEFRGHRGHNYILTADKQGYTSTRGVVSTMDVKRHSPDDTMYVTLYVDEISYGPFRLENIRYAFDDAAILPESAAELEKLINFMQDNPSLDVEIHSHTDSKGDDAYNMSLSQKRAESVVNYLVQNGVDRARLTAKGFGETQPIAQNTNADGSDNEAGRAMNRRTEFKIITEVPNRRMIFDSNKPGTIGEQSKNLEIDTESGEDAIDDASSEYSDAGARVESINK